MNLRRIKTLWKKITTLLIAYPGLGLLRILLSTCRINVTGMENFAALPKKQKCILAFWHNRLAIIAYVLNKYAPNYHYAAFISKSRDGELLAAAANSYRQGKAIRVAQQNSHHALREMIRQLKTGNKIILITPDGPRGPKYHAKSGIVLAAQNTRACIIPLTWSASKFWQLRTWDRLILPKPFSKVTVKFGEPFIMCQPGSDSSLKANAFLLQEILNSLSRRVCESITTNSNAWPK